MKHKRKIAWGLAVALMLTSFPVQTLANLQGGVPEIWVYKKLTHDKNQTADTIQPSIGLSWKPAAVLENTGDGHGKEEAEFYRIQLTNQENNTMIQTHVDVDKLGSELAIKLDQTTQFYDSNMKMVNTKIESGTRYEATVIAGHYHTIPGTVDRPPVEVPVLSSTKPAPVRFLTDFNTRVETADKGLKVSFEYVPGVKYHLYYVRDENGDYKIKSDFLKAEAGLSPIILTPAEVAALPRKDGRAEYTIEGLDPRGKYSLFVEPVKEGIIENYDINEYGKLDEPQGPKVISGMTAISLRIEIMNADSLKLVWGVVPASDLIKVVAEGRPKGSEKFVKIAEKNRIPGVVDDLTNIVVERPEVEMEYRIAFYFTGKPQPIYSNIAVYVPTFDVVPPYSPKIPELYTPTEPSKEDKVNYFVTDDEIAGDKQIGWASPQLMERTFHANLKEQPYIQVVWDAPMKINTEGKKQVDYSLVYDIWMGEDFDEVSKPEYEGIVLENQFILEGDTEHLITQHKKPSEVIGMRWKLTTDEKGEPIKKNKTYYIKIVAKKQVPGTSVSYVNSQPVVVGVTIDKDGNITKPSVIGKPPLQIKKDSITTQSMTVEWATLWAEIIANNPTNFTGDEKLLAESGGSRVYITGKNGDKTPIRFKPQEGIDAVDLYGKTKEDILGLIAGMPMQDYYNRFLNLDSSVKYEVAVEAYDSIYNRLNGKTLEGWMKDIASDDLISGLIWEKFEPVEGAEIESRGYNKWLEHKVKHTTNDGAELKPNTRYIIMLRAYREVDGEALPQSFPSYVIGSTLTDFPTIEPKPTAPVVDVIEDPDKYYSLDVEWEPYNSDFSYEIRYSTGDDPEKAKVWEFTIVDSADKADSTKNMYYFVEGRPARVTIRGLFPETYYNVWVRAKQKKGSLVSEWSTPDTGQTGKLTAPDVPRGLGPASKQSLKDLGLEYDPVGSDYITIEWMKNPDDLGVQTEGTMKKFYTYDIMFADNVAFEDSTVVTVTDALGSKDSVDFLAKVIAKHNKLLPNRPYYFKVRARVTISDS
ncbi:MAG: hypothetical protein ACRDDX_03380, partial [Cellulosilyticaceae bacterium]